jgi:hypothetical protein
MPICADMAAASECIITIEARFQDRGLAGKTASRPLPKATRNLIFPGIIAVVSRIAVSIGRSGR